MQGFNMGRYVPPEHEGTTSGNALHNKRARPATVRFEMPFPIWCTGCPRETLIPQGVRFNAEKQRVGAYLSTPIFAFRMRHPACGQTLEIRTDPQHTAYVVTAGARAQNRGEDRPAPEGTAAATFVTDEERARRRDDAFAALEVTVADRRQQAADAGRLAELQRQSTEHWDDAYAANQRLRRAFRAERKVRGEQAAKDAALQERMGLGFAIAEETRADKLLAEAVAFGVVDDDEEDDEADAREDEKEGKHGADGAEGQGVVKRKVKRGGRAVALPSGVTKEALQQVLCANTRAAVDPFSTDALPMKAGAGREARRLPVKRKRREGAEEPGPGPELEPNAKLGKTRVSLVGDGYDSD